jgi:hypothetical protein
MKNFTRRQLIAGAAGLGALSLLRTDWQSVSADSSKQKKAARPAPACNNGADFNVILHGLFLIELGGKKNPAGRPVRILTPKTDGMGIGHVYRAGSWNKTFTDFSGDCDSQWSTNNSQPDITGFPTIRKMTDHIDYSQSQFSIFLPWPVEFNRLRTIDGSLVVHTGIEAQWFPLALALRYKVPPADATPIQGCNWTKDQNFHIFAEPECKLSCDDVRQHGPDMVSRLLNMFIPPASFSLSQHPGSECQERAPDPCPPAPGVKPGEDNCLGELFPCTKRKKSFLQPSVHLPLCASILVTGS